MMTAVKLGRVFGASRNLADRVIRGAVVDFISVPRWRTFNLVDVTMVAGTAMGLWNLL
jgi:lipoprotein signal peptidase